MHDIKALRDDPMTFVRGWTARGMSDARAVADTIGRLDLELRTAQTALQEAQARRNELSKQIGQAKGRKDEAEAQRLMGEVERLKETIAVNFETEGRVASELRDLLASLPNLPADDVPPGKDENDNVEVRRRGTPRDITAPKDHVALGEALGGMDFEAAARMSGSRFVVLKGEVARMERALGQFMIDLHTQEHGYTEVSPPVFVRQEAMFGTAQLPKFYDDLFLVMDPVTRTELLTAALEDAQARVDGGPDKPDLARLVSNALDFAPMREQFFAIPTAEVSLTNLVREQILAEEELPLRYTALTPSFRAEAGASGKDTRGMIRQHQFYKVELVSITTPESSDAEHERMTTAAETVLERLELPFRRVLLCAGDMGFSVRKTYDLEVWLPSEGRYREISSCSTIGDFQARRMDARSRKSGEKGTRFVHTLNGSGVAVGRALIAVMENYQDEDGRIAVPKVLQPYMGGQTHIG
jgi:seryl-tRNA synthetase